jgi:hypothetical protein
LARVHSTTVNPNTWQTTSSCKRRPVSFCAISLLINGVQNPIFRRRGPLHGNRFVKTKLMVSMSGECPPNQPNDPYFPRREKPGVFKSVQTSRPPMYDNRCQELVRSVAKVSKDADGDSTDRVTHTRFRKAWLQTRFQSPFTKRMLLCSFAVFIELWAVVSVSTCRLCSLAWKIPRRRSL